MLKNMRFSENSFFSRKRVGLGLFTVTLISKNVLDGNHELKLGFALKSGILLKSDKMRRTF
jgi:hypothetical protein